jgi:hypothetical protein
VLRGAADPRGAPTNADCTARNSSTAAAHAQLTQVDGCSKDLTGTEFLDYHRRSRVCKQHMRDLEVMLNGRAMRFCHQVSKKLKKL